MSCLVMEYSAVVDPVHDKFWLGVVFPPSPVIIDLCYRNVCTW